MSLIFHYQEQVFPMLHLKSVVVHSVPFVPLGSHNPFLSLVEFVQTEQISCRLLSLLSSYLAKSDLSMYLHVNWTEISNCCWWQYVLSQRRSEILPFWTIWTVHFNFSFAILTEDVLSSLMQKVKFWTKVSLGTTIVFGGLVVGSFQLYIHIC